MSKVNYERFQSVMKKHSPEVLCAIGIVSTAIAFAMGGRKMKARYYELMYAHTGNEFYLIRHYQLTKTNNWLKMHGYPMRRKRH